MDAVVEELASGGVHGKQPEIEGVVEPHHGRDESEVRVAGLVHQELFALVVCNQVPAISTDGQKQVTVVSSSEEMKA